MKTSKLLALALATLLALSSFAFVGCGKPDYSTSSEGLEFELNDDETGYVLTGLGTCTEEEIVVTNYNDLPVYEISYYVFAGCTKLKNIVLGKDVNTLGPQAFVDCTNLKKVTFLGTIDDWVQIIFFGSYSNPLEFADKLYIDDKLVTEINITTATEIDGGAFCGYSKLTKVTIGKSVKTIYGVPFAACKNLTSIEVDPDNTSYKSVDGNLYSKDIECPTLINYCAGKKDTAFTVPDFVKGIHSGAFNGCDNLVSINIGANVTHIETSPIINCKSLVSIEVDPSSTYYASVNGALYNRNWDYTAAGLLCYPQGKTDTIYTAPETLDSIYSKAFCNATNLESIVVTPSSLWIQIYAFDGCDNLKNVFYCGTEDNWDRKIDIDNNGNDALHNATVYFYSEIQPTDSGNYWHYVNNVPTKW